MTAARPAPTSGPKSPRACQDWLCPDCEVQVVHDTVPWCRDCGHIWSWDEVACPYPAERKHRRHGVLLCRLHIRRADAVL